MLAATGVPVFETDTAAAIVCALLAATGSIPFLTIVELKTIFENAVDVRLMVLPKTAVLDRSTVTIKYSVAPTAILWLKPENVTVPPLATAACAEPICVAPLKLLLVFAYSLKGVVVISLVV